MKKKKNIKNKKKISTKKYQKYEKVKVRKIKYGRIFLVLSIFFLIIYLITSYVKFPIKNIYIYNNNILSDQQIIELAGLQDYPSYFYETKYEIKKKLEKNIYIKKATIKKKKLKEIHIYIEENQPLFYDATNNKTVFEDKKELEDKLNVPLLVNYVPDTIYDSFIEKISSINKDIRGRISEIKYDPNKVDNERFLLTMNDGNYVYLTLEKFEVLNSYTNIYLDIIHKYGNKVGILYLDSGEYFKILE